MRRLVYWFVSVLLSGLLNAALAQTSPLNVAIDESLYPYTYVDPNGKAMGTDVELLQAAAKQIGLEIRFLPLPWKRVLQVLETGEVHLAMPLFLTPERERYAQFVTPVHFSATALFVMRDRQDAIKGISDLNGKTIGYNRGYALPDQLAQAISQRKVVAEEVNSTQQNVQKLILGRLDAFVGNYVNTTTAMRTIPGGEKIIALPNLLSVDRPAFLVFSRQASIPERTNLELGLKKAIESIRRDGMPNKL